tara:strand:+ start:41 stop:2032 length:1992 start_codon:yes stop_codon:yes gene_type:complete
MNKYSNYRPEIDGLRAVAVLAVIFYHAEISILDIDFFSGGFIGVDIFFVISGYLITKIILNELKLTGKFSYLNFYKRRARRILPILFFVMLFSFPFVYHFAISSFFIDYAKSIISSVIFISNYYFWHLGIGYDQLQTIQFQPFLHTWSLSVEEQFYIVFPICLIFIIKFLKKYTTSILFFGFFISLFAADFLSQTHASINFYSLPTRGWELLAGSLLANFEIKYGRKNEKKFTILFPLIGITLIIYSFVSFNDRMFLPSITTLIPVIGVCLIIWYSQKNCLITNLLSSKIFVGTGLISYSLYLWHYPIFVLFNSINLLLLIISIFALSIGSYFLIEKPFRSKSKLNKFYNLKTLLFASITLLLINLTVISQNGFQKNKNYPKIINNIIFEKDPNNKNKKFEKQTLDNSKRDLFIVGDSHMDQLKKVLGQNEEIISRFNFHDLNSIGCYYIFGFDKVQKYSLKVENYCNKKTQEDRKKAMLSGKKPIAIIGGRLPMYLSGERYDNGEGGREQREWWFLKGKGELTAEEAVKKSIEELLDNNVDVILVYPVPPVGFDVTKKLFDLYMWNKEDFTDILKSKPLTTSYSNFLNYAENSHSVLNSLKHKNLYKIFPHEIFCDTEIKNRCLLHDNDEIFYVDNNHLSKAGNKKILRVVLDKLEKIELKN